MGTLPLVHGVVAPIVLCTLIFLEETGVPLPLLPGDILLFLGGRLISSAGLDLWAYIPLVTVAAIAGALCGYGVMWRVGPGVLRALATKLHVARALDRACERLACAGPRGVLVARLVPGLRVSTTLVAGAVHVPVRTLLAGLAPAVVVWVAAMTTLGVVAGAPIVSLLIQVERAAVVLACAMAAVAASAFTLRRAVRRR